MQGLLYKLVRLLTLFTVLTTFCVASRYPHTPPQHYPHSQSHQIDCGPCAYPSGAGCRKIPHCSTKPVQCGPCERREGNKCVISPDCQSVIITGGCRTCHYPHPNTGKCIRLSPCHDDVFALAPGDVGGDAGR
ncbi:hypothetical protein E2C01_016255 [Portunus trituberculatus]|uniref:Uncharacterized protein n=1 Tax=Portunus trituberculatus TaxID=210409 RepID=A0A5B7DQA5_PORTR|nr:hypothetical protein [Portunus trituberculatus]